VTRPSPYYDHATSSETGSRGCPYIRLFVCSYPNVSPKVDMEELRNRKGGAGREQVD
jgi:hypothetical protein